MRNGIVVRVVTRRDLQRAGSEFHAHIFITNDGDLTAEHGHDGGLADEFLETFIFRVDCHSRIAEDRFRADGRHRDELI